MVKDAEPLRKKPVSTPSHVLPTAKIKRGNKKPAVDPDTVRRHKSWEQRLLELIAFKKKFGHCRVSTLSKEYKALGHWVRTQRGRRRLGILPNDRIKKLDRLGFMWDRPKLDDKAVARIRRKLKQRAKIPWEAAFLRLSQFRKEFGHCRVPASEEYAFLKNWVRLQRLARSSGDLSRKQVRRLDELGFLWNAWDERWENFYELVLQYKKIHGDSNVPKNWPEDPKLAAWVRNQRHYNRSGELQPQRKARLEAIGFRWSVGPEQRDDDRRSP